METNTTVDPSDANPPYDDSKETEFEGADSIQLDGASFSGANLRGAKLGGGFGDGSINLSGTDLSDSNRGDAALSSTSSYYGYYGYGEIDFTGTETTQATAKTNGLELTAKEIIGMPPSPPLPPSPPPSPAPPPSALPCTLEMLRLRPANAVDWPIRCVDRTIYGIGEELELSEVHLSRGDFSGDFENATFVGAGTIKMDGADLVYTVMRDAKLTVTNSSNGKALISFTATDFTKTDLRDAEIEFADTDLTYDLTDHAPSHDQALLERTGQKLNADMIPGPGPSPPPLPEPPTRPTLPPPSLPSDAYRYAEANSPRVPPRVPPHYTLDTGEARVTNTVGEAKWSLCGGQAVFIHAVLIAVLIAIGIIFGLKDALTQSPLGYGESEPNESDGGDGRGSTGGESDGDESDGGGSDESDGDDGNKHDESERDESDGDESDGNDETAQKATRRLESRMIQYYMKAVNYARGAEVVREAEELAKAISASLHSPGNDDDDLSNFTTEDDEDTDMPVLLLDSDGDEEDDEVEENDSEYDILSLSELSGRSM